MLASMFYLVLARTTLTSQFPANCRLQARMLARRGGTNMELSVSSGYAVQQTDEDSGRLLIQAYH